MPKKNSKLRSLPKDELEKIVKDSISISQILKHFGMQNKGSNTQTLRRVLKDYQIDISHLKIGLSCNKGRKFGPKKDIKEYLTENSSCSRGVLKRRCLEDGLLENKCSECGQSGEWNNKKLVMVLDHINGVSNDNRIENLRMLCPNCNSQTDTFAGRNTSLAIKNRIETPIKKEIAKKHRKQKIEERRKNNWPSKEVLEKLVWEKSTTSIAHEYKVSDNAVAKWCKAYQINKPGRGYWRKKECGKI